MIYQVVLNFWFNEIEPKQWWTKDDELDRLITDKFQATHDAAASGELSSWQETASGRLAEIIVLDQFSRNIYRDTPSAFAFDRQALELAKAAIMMRAQQSLEPRQRAFLYMPFMHSESALIHETAIELFSEPGLEYSLEFELRHKEIIDRFGRYPHRNEILGRKSTIEEMRFLNKHSSSF